MSELPSLTPDVRLSGTVDEAMLRSFLEQTARVADQPRVVIEMTTTGGDADVARRIALDVRLLRERADKDLYFFGKSTIYSAGVTVMSAFPVGRRFLSADASLLIHERRLEKQVHLSGALRASAAVVKDLLAEIENSLALERDGFADLIRGSSLSMETLMDRVMTSNWYLRAPEALRLGLAAAVI